MRDLSLIMQEMLSRLLRLLCRLGLHIRWKYSEPSSHIWSYHVGRRMSEFRHCKGCGKKQVLTGLLRQDGSVSGCSYVDYIVNERKGVGA